MIQLVEEATPFTMPSNLKQVLSHSFEYGTAGRNVHTCDARYVWRIELISEAGVVTDIAGYVWVSEHLSLREFKGSYINMHVFAPHQKRAVGTEALRRVEPLVSGKGIHQLFAQVNGFYPHSGWHVRLWLLDQGYSVHPNQDRTLYESLSDRTFAAQCPQPVFFVKDIGQVLPPK